MPISPLLSPGSTKSAPELNNILKRLLVDSGSAPGAVATVAHFSAGRWSMARGAAGHISAPQGALVRENTIYDLASITKPACALVLARLVQTGGIRFETQLADVLPEAGGSALARTPLELLLSHRAGLEAHLELFAPLRTQKSVSHAEALQTMLSALRPDCRGPLPEHGFAPVYSDLGYMLLGMALERVTSTPLDRLVDQELNAPLGTSFGSAELWSKSPEFDERVAPTEVVDFRGGTLSGLVHDENAFALAGRGTMGHAGLFADSTSVATLGTAVVDALHQRGAWLRSDLAHTLTRPRPGGTLRAGFDGKSDSGSSAGVRFSNESFGHLGFTGTSVWCDPSAEVVVAVLTNRVHPTRENTLIRQYRPLVNDALFELAARLG